MELNFNIAGNKISSRPGFLDNLEDYSHNIALITEDSKKITYRELMNAADSIANRIKQRCFVFVICRNSFDCVAGYVGFMRAKIVPALISDTIDQALFQNLLDQYRPAYVFLPAKGAKQKVDGVLISLFGEYALLKTNFDMNYVLHDDLALLMATSGSTGSPRFVRQSYKNLRSNTEAISKYLHITHTDRPITTMPMNYAYGLSIINTHLYSGASIVLSNATLMDRRFWELIESNQVTTFGGVPYIYEMLKKLRFENFNLSSFKYVTQAGGKLSPKLSSEFIAICAQKNVKFFIMYGQTEACARMSYLPWEYAHVKSDSIGVAIPGGRFWIINELGEAIEESEVSGELVYQGDNVMLGYAENCFDLCRGDENKGILYTGDIAKRDVDNFYYIVGRKSRFLKMYGTRVNLNEVECLLKAENYNCACAGSDNNLTIYLTEIDGQSSVKSYISKLLNIHQAGISIVYVDDIPRNSSGKILYSDLEKMVE